MCGIETLQILCEDDEWSMRQTLSSPFNTIRYLYTYFENLLFYSLILCFLFYIVNNTFLELVETPTLPTVLEMRYHQFTKVKPIISLCTSNLAQDQMEKTEAWLLGAGACPNHVSSLTIFYHLFYGYG